MKAIKVAKVGCIMLQSSTKKTRQSTKVGKAICKSFISTGKGRRGQIYNWCRNAFPVRPQRMMDENETFCIFFKTSQCNNHSSIYTHCLRWIFDSSNLPKHMRWSVESLDSFLKRYTKCSISIRKPVLDYQSLSTALNRNTWHSGHLLTTTKVSWYTTLGQTQTFYPQIP